jgi:uncharacterized protein YneF (UPF0154 family)
MKRQFTDVFFVVMPLTALMFGAIIYFFSSLKAHGHQGIVLACMLGATSGIVFGIIFGYFVRSLEYDFNVDPKVAIAPRLQMLMMDMGYRMENQFSKVMTFKPTLRAGVFADRIRVEFTEGHVRIEGPHWHVERVRSNLSL